MISKNSIAMIGAGLAGPLMATFLTRHGYQVEIYERRSDMREKKQSSGRSINLALSRRGIEALKNIGLYDSSDGSQPFLGRDIAMNSDKISEFSREKNDKSR